jgi:hypothetical protein
LIRISIWKKPVFGWEKLFFATARMWETAGVGSPRSAWTETQRMEYREERSEQICSARRVEDDEV